MIHAGNPVQIVSLETEHWQEHYIGAKRVCGDESAETNEPNLITGEVVFEEELIYEEFEFIPKADEPQPQQQDNDQ